MIRRALLRYLALGLPVDDREPVKLLLLTSGRSWTFMVHGIFTTRETWERGRKRVMSTSSDKDRYEFNPPIEMTADKIWEKPQ